MKNILLFLFMFLWMPTLMAEEVSIEQLGALYQEGDQAYSISDYSTALKKWEQGLVLAEQVNDKLTASIFLSNICNVYLSLEEYSKALDCFEQAIVIERKIMDKQGIGNNLNNIGIIHWNLGQNSKALDYYKQALVIHKEIQDEQGIGSDLMNIGIVYDDLGQYHEALNFFQQALEITEKIGDEQGIGNNLTNIGNVYSNLRQYQKALDFYQQALEIDRKLGDKRSEGTDLTNIGIVYQNLGQYQKALDFYQQSLKIDRKFGNKKGEGADLGNIGVVYQSLGQYQKALDFQQQSLKIDKKLGNRKGEGADLTNIGIIYDYLGQYQKALDFFQQALEIYKKLENKKGEIANLNNISNIYVNLGQYQKALDLYLQALEKTRKIGGKIGTGDILMNVGAVYDSLEQYNKALNFYQQSTTIAREVGDKRLIGDNLMNVGLIYGKLGKRSKAKDVFQESLAIRKSINSAELWAIQCTLAIAESELKEYDSAVMHYEQAIDNIEKLRAALQEKEHKLSFMQNKLYVYDEFITLLKTLHSQYPDKNYDRKAIEIFERKQGRIFLEEMGKSGARLFAGLPPELTQKEEDLQNQITATRKNLTDQRSKPITEQNQDFIKELEQRIESIQSEQQTLENTFKNDYPDYYALKYPKPATLEELQNQVLDSNELLLIYGVMKDSTTLWLIGKNTFQMFDLGLTEESLEKDIKEFRQFMGIQEVATRGASRKPSKKGDSATQFAQVSHELYKKLVPEKVRSLLTLHNMVYIIPTSALYALPFEALITQPPEKSKTPHYLIQDVPIAYLSSASLLKTLREAKTRRKTKAKYPFLAFADPVYESTAVQNNDAIQTLRTESYRALRDGEFAELPETGTEARVISVLLEAPRKSFPLQLKEKASRPTVFQLNDEQKLDDYQYILFATHGILPNEVDRVMQAALVLSQPETQGYLTMADVFALKLNAKLVSLSACNTGSGEKMRGEGVMGLTRAFMYAGTPAIAVTLWSVDSLSAKDLSIGFFKQIKNIRNPALALQAIKLRMLQGLEGKEYQRPYHWASFVVFGDVQ